MNINGSYSSFSFTNTNDNGKRLRENEEYSNANKRQKIESENFTSSEGPSPQDYIDKLASMCEDLFENKVIDFFKENIPDLSDECWELLRWIVDNIDFGPHLTNEHETLFSRLIDLSCYHNDFDLTEKLILKLPYIYQANWGHGETMLTHKINEIPKKLLYLLVFLKNESHNEAGKILKISDALCETSMPHGLFSEIVDKVENAQDKIKPIQQEISKIFNNIFFTLYCDNNVLSSLPPEMKEKVYIKAIKESEYLKDIPIKLIRDQIGRLEGLYMRVKSDRDLDMQAGRILHSLRVHIDNLTSEGQPINPLTSEEVSLLKSFILFKLKQNKSVSEIDLFNFIRS